MSDFRFEIGRLTYSYKKKANFTFFLGYLNRRGKIFESFFNEKGH